MTDFLTFLNTADLDSLRSIPGVSRTLAANIIAARPFDFVEDALHVKGMGKNLLGKMQSYFEEEINAPESRAMVPVEEGAPPAPIEKIESEPEPPPPQGPSFAARMRQAFLNFLWAMFKLILTVAVISILGLALYYALPYINRTLIQPMEQNTARIADLDSELAASRQEITELRAQLDEVNGRIDTLEETIETHTASLTELEEIQGALEEQMQDRDDAIGMDIKRRLMLVRSIEYLSRARLYLSQSNFGLAREDVQASRDLLLQLQKDSPDYQRNAIAAVVMRLDFALANLPEFPVVAVSDVDIAWALLMNGLPESEAEAAITPTPQTTPTLTITPTAESIPSVTATP